MEQNDFMAAMQQSAPETTSAMTENKSGAEKTANAVATITLLFGSLVLLIGIILMFVFFDEHNDIAAWISLVVGLLIFIFNLIIWSFAKMFSNMSYRLSSIDSKLGSQI
ncbi:MAG: hypothetical protein J6W13_07100 [Salinivirgaceae bacterium]|nr:hypothetical protein [Salinivirgaceae bacterium]